MTAKRLNLTPLCYLLYSCLDCSPEHIGVAVVIYCTIWETTTECDEWHEPTLRHNRVTATVVVSYDVLVAAAQSLLRSHVCVCLMVCRTQICQRSVVTFFCALNRWVYYVVRRQKHIVAEFAEVTKSLPSTFAILLALPSLTVCYRSSQFVCFFHSLIFC